MPVEVDVMSENMLRLKLLSKSMFEDLDDINLFTIHFHMLYQIAKDVTLFGDPNFLDSSPTERFNYMRKTI